MSQNGTRTTPWLGFFRWAASIDGALVPLCSLLLLGFTILQPQLWLLALVCLVLGWGSFIVSCFVLEFFCLTMASGLVHVLVFRYDLLFSLFIFV